MLEPRPWVMDMRRIITPNPDPTYPTNIDRTFSETAHRKQRWSTRAGPISKRNNLEVA